MTLCSSIRKKARTIAESWNLFMKITQKIVLSKIFLFDLHYNKGGLRKKK